MSAPMVMQAGNGESQFSDGQMICGSPAQGWYIRAEVARNPLEIRIYINLLSQQETGGDRLRPPLLATGTACATHLYEKRRT